MKAEFTWDVSRLKEWNEVNFNDFNEELLRNIRHVTYDFDSVKGNGAYLRDTGIVVFNTNGEDFTYYERFKSLDELEKTLKDCSTVYEHASTNGSFYVKVISREDNAFEIRCETDDVEDRVVLVIFDSKSDKED